MSLGLESGLRLVVNYPHRLFPSLGIWWNRGGYPGEEGCRRTECAFEPMPGTWSSLARSAADGHCLTAPARGSLSWEIVWTAA